MQVKTHLSTLFILIISLSSIADTNGKNRLDIVTGNTKVELLNIADLNNQFVNKMTTKSSEVNSISTK